MTKQQTSTQTRRKPKVKPARIVKLLKIARPNRRHRTGKTVSLTSPICPVCVVDSSGNIDITNLSRTKLARAVKVDLAHISRIFSGKRSPSLDLARRIADYMGVSLEKLQAFLDGRQP